MIVHYNAWKYKGANGTPTAKIVSLPQIVSNATSSVQCTRVCLDDITKK